jgi:hypothetical protein
MNHDNPKTAARKQKAIHELKETTIIFLYLGLFFCAVTLFANLLMRANHGESFSYVASIIAALVITKVILIGEYAKLGKKQESKPLVQSAVIKAFLFALLALVFHVAEESIKRHLHHEAFATALQPSHIYIQLARTLVVFCGFIPLFAFRELRQMVGEEAFHHMVFSKRPTPVKPQAEVGLPKAGD